MKTMLEKATMRELQEELLRRAIVANEEAIARAVATVKVLKEKQTARVKEMRRLQRGIEA